MNNYTEESFTPARMLEVQKLARALCQCIGGKTTLVKYFWALSIGTMLWGGVGQFDNVCPRKHTFLLLRNPIVRIHLR